LIDTAGLRETADPIESIGVERALGQAGAADLVVWLSAADGPAEPPAFAVPVLRVATKGGHRAIARGAARPLPFPPSPASGWMR